MNDPKCLAIRSLKILLLILLVPILFAATSSASTLARLDSLRLAAVRYCGVSPAALTKIGFKQVNSYVNISIQQVSSDFPAVRKATTITCSDGVASYAISDTTFRDLIWCRIWRSKPPTGTQNLAVLKVIPADSVYEYVQEGQSLPKTDAPLNYAYSWGDTVHVFPSPNYKDTLKIGYCAIGRFLSGDTATTDIRPEYRHLIVLYTAMQIANYLDLTDKVNQFLNQYRHAIVSNIMKGGE